MTKLFHNNTDAQAQWINFLLCSLDIISLILVSVYIFIGRDAVPFHGDEATIIRMSKDYTYIVQEHNLRKVMYSEQSENINISEQHQRINIGAIAPFTIGVVWNLAGMNANDLNGFWTWFSGLSDYSTEWDWNIERGNLPGQELLRVARTPSTLFTIFSVYIVFGIAWKMTRSHLAAWACMLIYGTNPSILVNGRRAVQEGALLFFTAVVIYIALFIIQEMRKPKYREGWILFLYVLMGIAGGLALASKHNAALILAAVYLAVLFAPLLLPKHIYGKQLVPNFTRWAGSLIGSGFLSLAIFICFMPVWWTFWYIIPFSLSMAILFMTIFVTKSDWKIRIINGSAVIVIISVMIGVPGFWGGVQQPFRIIVQERTRLLANSTATMDTLGERSEELVHELFFADAQYFEVPYWTTFDVISGQIRAYENAHLNGFYGGPVWGILLITLVIIGVWVLVRQWQKGETLLTLLLLLLPMSMLLLLNPLPWQRYYIVLQPQLCITAGIGISHLINKIVWFQKHGQIKAPG